MCNNVVISSDRLTFWRNWYTAARQLPDDLRLAWFDAVLDFAFDGKEPTTGESVASAIGFQAVQMVRATIEISRKRREIGSKGGAKRKQSGSKTKANRNQDQEQEQDQDHNGNRSLVKATTATRKQPPTIEQFLGGAKLAGVPEDFARPFYSALVAAGWADAEGAHVANWRRYLKSAFLEEQKKISAARGQEGVAVLTLDDFPDAH